MESAKKLRIAVLCDWYLPGYKAGGPIQSVANLVASLDHDFDVITSDRDLGETNAYPGVVVDKWTSGLANERVIYLSPKNQTQEKFKELVSAKEYDAIYLNSMFSPAFSIKPMQAIRELKISDKVVLAPRGMLKSGAMAQKGWKKRAFLTVAKTLGWYKNIRWHATNDLEGEEIKRVFGNSDIRIAPNLVSVKQSDFRPTEKKVDFLKMITVARVSPEKNILGAINYLSELELEGKQLQWEIFGTQNDAGYLAECQEAAKKISAVKIQFRGEIMHNQIGSQLDQNHLFYLPTLGENYGHSIVESFLSGTPVLISDKTPWKELCSANAGWDLPLDSLEFPKIISSCLRMDQSAYNKWAEGAHALGLEIAFDTEARSANNNLFLH